MLLIFAGIACAMKAPMWALFWLVLHWLDADTCKCGKVK